MLVPFTSFAGPEKQETNQSMKKGMRILFQGDSITDCGRDRVLQVANTADALGKGYALLIAAGLLRVYPDRAMEFFNRGVSGDKVPDLKARWETDTLALKPDIVSILVGVNDYWHRKTHGYAGTNADYAEEYRDLLLSTRSALPYARIIVLEPFVLRAGAVAASWFPEFDELRAAAAKAAEAVQALFVPLQSIFSTLAGSASAEYWTADGVHPTIAGHAVIADQWQTALGL